MHMHMHLNLGSTYETNMQYLCESEFAYFT